MGISHGILSASGGSGGAHRHRGCPRRLNQCRVEAGVVSRPENLQAGKLGADIDPIFRFRWKSTAAGSTFAGINAITRAMQVSA